MKYGFSALILLPVLIQFSPEGGHPYLAVAFAPVVFRHRGSTTTITDATCLFVAREIHPTSNQLDDEIHDLYAELKDVGLGLCHGILQASGVRYLSDLSQLTSANIDDMGMDSFDRRAIVQVIDKISKNKDSDPFKLTTLSPFLSPFDETFSDETKTFQHDFEIKAISEEHHIYKGRLFTKEQCQQLNLMAESHAYKSIGKFGEGWTSQLYTLTDQHMQCKDIPKFMESTQSIVTQLLEHELPLLFAGILPSQCTFSLESIEEPHLVRYSGKASGTKLHQDSPKITSVTINALLSATSEFRGGGTYIQMSDETIYLEQGEMLIHLGDLEHAGVDITSGVRRLMVAFLKCTWEEENGGEGSVPC